MGSIPCRPATKLILKGMNMSLKHLSETRDVKDFFSRLRRFDLINFHPQVYTSERVCSIGRDYGWFVEYCGPSSEYYKKHGSFICRVVDRLSRNQRIIKPIDESTIATNYTSSWVNKKALRKFT